MCGNNACEITASVLVPKMTGIGVAAEEKGMQQHRSQRPSEPADHRIAVATVAVAAVDYTDRSSDRRLRYSDTRFVVAPPTEPYCQIVAARSQRTDRMPQYCTSRRQRVAAMPVGCHYYRAAVDHDQNP